MKTHLLRKEIRSLHMDLLGTKAAFPQGPGFSSLEGCDGLEPNEA